VKSDTYAPFRYPAFRRVLSGGLLVQVGTAAQSLAIGWEVFERTNDPLALGLVGLTQAIPMLLLTLPAGYLADVMDRKLLMMLSLVGATLTSIGLGLVSIFSGPTWLLFLMLFLDSTLIRMGSPARSAIGPLLVPREVFEGSIKWRTTLGHLSGVIGPAIGGLIIAWRIPAAYFFSAACSTLLLAMIARVRIRDEKRAIRGHMIQKVAEGLRYVWRRKIVLGATSLDLFAVLLGGAVYLLPIFARDIAASPAGPPFGMSAEQILGVLRAAPALGASAMALFLAYRPPIRHAGRMLLLNVAGFGVATIVFGLSKNFWLSGIALFLTGAFDNVSMVIRHGIVQLGTPNEMRGRVSAVSSIFIGSSNELGGFESGVVADLFGPIISVVSGGIGTLVVVLGWSRLFPQLRKLGLLTELSGLSPAKKRTGRISRPDH
jgi:MFS family permease